MRLVKFHYGNGAEIWVNPDLVRVVTPHNNGSTSLKFSEEHSMTVAEAGDVVVSTLASDD